MSGVQVSRSVPLPSTINNIEKQGMLTILGSNFQQNHIPPSLRRTLSADMSSRKWLSENGMSRMKRISPSEELRSEVDDQEEPKQNMPTRDDVWSSIFSEEKNNNLETNNQTPPYVHPLLRKSTSILSQKSLEICTESLGSETGSDGFYTPSQTSDDQAIEKQGRIEQKIQPFEDFQVEKYNYSPSHKKVGQKKSFPPPLPSLSGRNDGCSSLHMQSHRINGRLVLEVVSVPQQNFFQVDRQEGRLLLTLIKNYPQEQNTSEKLEERVAGSQEVLDNFDVFDVKDDETQEEEDEISEDDHAEDQMGVMIDQNSSSLTTSGVINIPMMKSFLGMGQKDALWSNKINKVEMLMEAEQVVGKLASSPRSLPPRTAAVARVIPLPSTKSPPPPTGPTMAVFNVYEYFWRDNRTSVAVGQQCSWNNIIDYNNDNHEQEVVTMRGNKGDYFVPWVCKENRRSLLV